MFLASMLAFRRFRALVGSARPEELPAPSRAVSFTDSEESLWAMPPGHVLYSQVAQGHPAQSWSSRADAPAGPLQSSPAPAPSKITDIIQGYLRDEASARASLESGGPCQSVDSLCNYAAASLTCMADGLIRKLPQMMNSINIQQEQELQECKAVLSSEKINHSATRQELEQCKAALSRERSNHTADLLDALQKLEKYKSKLEEQVEKGVDLFRKLEQESLLNQGISSKLANKTSELESLQTELLQKQHDINRLNSHIDELEFKVDRLERIGQDLMAYSGANPSHANLSALKAALKDLSSLTSTAATTIMDNGWGDAWVPIFVFALADEKKLRPTQHASLSHLVLSTVGSVVFGTFRLQHLLVETVEVAESTDDSLMCCQLKIEKQRSEAWLGLLQSSTAGTMPAHASMVVQEVTTKVLSALVRAHKKQVDWQFSTDQEANSALQPLVQPVVLAAMKAQAIASVMHSRLLQLVVPGWLSSTTALLSELARAPQDWSLWPGVVVFDRPVMDRGDSAAAAPGALQPASNTPAAVFCQEVGVVQLASSVKELRGASTPTGACGGGAAAGVLKVLKKPRMFLAV